MFETIYMLFRLVVFFIHFFFFFNVHCASLSFKIELKRGVNDPQPNILIQETLCNYCA